MFRGSGQTRAVVAALIRRGHRLMDAILHLGAHRTGTTTLQAYLRRNREALLDLRIAVWEPERMRGGLANGLTGATGALTPQAMRTAGRSVGLMRLEMARLEMAGIDRLLVSEENMIGSVRDNLMRSRLYPQLVPRLARFAGVFSGRCSRVVIAIRSYESYWASALAFALPNGLPMPDAARLDRLVTQPRRWQRVIEEVANSFPRAECLVWPFEALIGRPEAQLAVLTGEPVPVMQEPRRWLHPSPTRAMLRQALIDRGELCAAASIPPGNGRWQPFGPDHVEVLRALYAEDMAWLRDGAGGCATLIDSVSPTDAGPHPHGATEDRGPNHDQRREAAGAG